MIVFLLLATLLSQRTGALPTTAGAGPTTTPTIIHKVIFGILARSNCSDVRSTYEIVRSCLITIAACVYRAVHPNIPDPNLSFWGKLRVTVKITIYAVIAPEMVIYWAMRQRLGAKIVVEGVNALRPELRWSQTHGQFAQMGGFGRKDDKHILHPPSLIQLLKDGQIDVDDLRLSEKEINDKSKGDILSKGLVAFQTSWFVFECLARLHQGLPIIEIEVVTLAFATLNAITYALWWYKPLNVMCPIYLHVHPIALANPPTDSGLPPREALSIIEPEEDSDSLLREEIGGAVSGEGKAGMVMKVKEMGRGMVRWAWGVIKGVSDEIECVSGEIKKDVRENGWFRTAGRWLIVKPFITLTAPLSEMLQGQQANDGATYVSTFYSMETQEERLSWVIVSSSFIGMIFGGIHFLSWHSTFPKHVQLVLWRTSSIIMVIQPFLVLLTGVSSILQNRAPPGSGRKAIARAFMILFSVITFAGGTVPYILARFSIVVLAFLTLRDIPIRAFTDVSWTAYIPHF